MTMPRFSAENSVGRPILYQLGGGGGERKGIQPQGIPLGVTFGLARCLPQFETVWVLCNPELRIYCPEIRFMGFACH